MSLTAEDIVELAIRLRMEGFGLTMHEVLSATDLVLGLHIQGCAPREPADWRPLLAPVFCKTPEEQERFHRAFNEWSCSPGAPVSMEAIASDRAVRSSGTAWRVMIVGVVAVVMVGLLVSSEEIVRIVTLGNLSAVAAGVTAVSALALILRFFAHRGVLRRVAAASGEGVELQLVLVQGAYADLFPATARRRASEALRVPELRESVQLDERRSVERTIRSDGYFTAVRRTTNRMPEYVALIDCAHPGDHLAQFGLALVDGVRMAGTQVYVYFFFGDVRRCQPEHAPFRALHLEDVEARHGQARLLLLSDCAGLFSPLSGGLEPWARRLLAWRERAVLTSRSFAEWGYPERVLAEQGFFIAALLVDSLTVLAERFENPEQPVGPAQWISTDVTTSPLPELITRHGEAMLEDKLPQRVAAEEIYSALLDYLGPQGMRVLSALAIYPSISWLLTLYWDFELRPVDEKEGDRQLRVLALSRLPWCRRCHMGTELRQYLLRRISREDADLFRSTVSRLLQAAICDRGRSVELHVPTYHDSSADAHITETILPSLSSEAARDHVFVGTMTKRTGFLSRRWR